MGDWNRINQIILNLISNSLKFTAENGNIRFHCSYTDAKLIIVVQDDGIGMSEEVKNKIFQPFIQADGSISRKYGGTGLGLAIAQNLVETMDGKIFVESEEGNGSTFTVHIPLKMLESITAFNQQIKEKELNAKEPLNVHVLVAEDNKTNQILIEMLLEEIGVTCEVVNDGIEALESYNPSLHAAILMDENMPNMNGSDSMKAIREKFQDKCTPIISLTANAMAGDREKFIADGMNGYVSKPIDEQELYDEIKRCLHV